MSAAVYQGTVKQNEKKNLESVADGYESKLEIYDQNWLAYALQKDAIQNSWDAKCKNTFDPHEWSTTFEIKQFNDNPYLIITDTATTGLLGTIFEDDESLDKILSSDNQNENLAYFLNSNFSSKSSESGGKRGRGKSLFLVASRKKAFYFESLREDGSRVYGGQWLEESSKSIKNLLTKDRNEFNKFIDTNNEVPLGSSGTKIYIPYPHKSIINTIDSGIFQEYISKTWWEIIKKFNANIYILNRSGINKCVIPEWYDENNYPSKSSWGDYKQELIQVGGSNLKNQIKKIVLFYVPEEAIPKDVKGISIQRRGMSIERIPSEKLVRSDGMEKVYGWVELNETLEENLYELEDVEHLSFRWNNNPAKELRATITKIAKQFAKEVKIIEADDTKKYNLNRNIEKVVAEKINKYLSSLGFKGLSSYGKVRRKGRVSKENPVRISFANFDIPRSSRRVEFDESINAIATIVNDTKYNIHFRFKTWIVHQDSIIKSTEEDIKILGYGTYDLGWNNLTITKADFPEGLYSFKAKATILEDTDIKLKDNVRLEKGFEVKSSLSFSVNQDHKSHGFLDFKAISSNDKSIYVVSEESNDGSIVIQYNTEHPYIKAIRPVDENDKDNFEKTQNFLMETGIIIAFNQVLRGDIESANPKIFDDLTGEDIDPTTIMPRLMEEVSKFMWEIKSGY